MQAKAEKLRTEMAAKAKDPEEEAEKIEERRAAKKKEEQVQNPPHAAPLADALDQGVTI